jgi:hypothetical protein
VHSFRFQPVNLTGNRVPAQAESDPKEVPSGGGVGRDQGPEVTLRGFLFPTGPSG